MRTPHAKAQLRKRRETDFWRAVNSCLLLLIGVGAVVVISLAFVPELRRVDEMRATLAGLQKDLAAQQLLLAQGQREEKWLNESPEYVELRARDLLGVMKKGDTIVRLDEPAPAAQAAAPAAPAADSHK